MFKCVNGVDFSGAKLAGRNTWVAQLEPGGGRKKTPPYRLTALSRLETLCGTAERGPALAHLAGLIAESDAALWAMDFPFGLPIEVMQAGGAVAGAAGVSTRLRRRRLRSRCRMRSPGQGTGRPNAHPPAHRPRGQDAFRLLPLPDHLSDFLRDAQRARSLHRTRDTAILPFHYRRLATARRVLVEACPASTLKRLGLPHQNYKQAEGGPLTRKRLLSRRAILAGLAGYVALEDRHRRVVMRNGGGDALDAVIAAVEGRRPGTRRTIGAWRGTRAIRARGGCSYDARSG